MLKEPKLLSTLLPDGSEVLDPTPMSLPVGFERPESIQSMIRRMVTDPALRSDLNAADVESFEEADDFDIPDDDVPQTPHEDRFDPLHLLSREMEVSSGTVAPITPEAIANAKALLKAARKQPPAPAAPVVPTEAPKP